MACASPLGAHGWKTRRVLRHEPPGYSCPFCRILREEFDERNAETDMVTSNDLAFARIAPEWWPDNPGAALVIPKAHHENLYSLPREDGHAVWDLTQQVAIAMRTAYGCEGISIRQHNEPAGNQDAWHLHVHVFPRYEGDRLYERHLESRWVTAAERAPYAQQLKAEQYDERRRGQHTT